MRPTLALFGALALLPAMIGPLRAEARMLVAPICAGIGGGGGSGTTAIPLPARDAPPGPPQGPCCAKGCHSDGKRKRLDRSQ